MILSLLRSLLGDECPFCHRYAWPKFHRCKVLHRDLTAKQAVELINAKIREILADQPADRFVHQAYEAVDKLNKAMESKENLK